MSLYRDRGQRQQTVFEGGVGVRKSWKGSTFLLGQAGVFFSHPEQSLNLIFEKR